MIRDTVMNSMQSWPGLLKDSTLWSELSSVLIAIEFEGSELVVFSFTDLSASASMQLLEIPPSDYIIS